MPVLADEEALPATDISRCYYDPTTAQFLTRDPLSSITRSAYGYGENDPVNNTDPMGLCSEHGGIFGGLRDAACEVGEGDLDEAAGAAGRAAGEAAKNPVVQTAFVVGACTGTGGLGCFAANGIVVTVNAGNRYDPNEGFSASFLAHTAIDAAFARFSYRSLRGFSAAGGRLDRFGGVLMRYSIRDGHMPFSLAFRHFWGPNALKGGGLGLGNWLAHRGLDELC